MNENPRRIAERYGGNLIRIVGAQRVLQSLGDPLPGYTTIDGRHFFVRQMKNLKASMPIELKRRPMRRRESSKVNSSIS